MPKGVYKRTEKHLKALSDCRIGKPTLERRKKKGGYDAIHKWLKATYGKANKCESPLCTGSSYAFQWAKREGFEHAHNRDHYWMLCAQCHWHYDDTPEKHEKQAKTLKETIKKRPDLGFQKGHKPLKRYTYDE